MATPVLGYVAAGAVFVPAAVGIARYKLLDQAMKLFTVFSLTSCLSVSAAFILGLFKIKNYIVSDIYHLVEVPFLALIYHTAIASASVRRILKGCILVYVAVWLADQLYFADPARLNNALAMTSRIFLVVMSIIALHAFLKSTEARLTKEPMFWIITGTILYSSGSLVVVALSNELYKMGLTYFVIGWYINWTLSIVATLMFTKGLLCSSQAQTYYGLSSERV